MAKFQFNFVLLLVIVALCNCEVQRHNGRSGFQNRNRQFSRQKVEEPITPYPSADELKPEVPFDETATADESTIVQEEEIASINETAEGVANEPTPDEVYGPPNKAVLYNTPDEIYGPPEIEANSLPFDALARQKKARLVNVRSQAAYRQNRVAKLRAVKPTRFT